MLIFNSVGMYTICYILAYINTVSDFWLWLYMTSVIADIRNMFISGTQLWLRTLKPRPTAVLLFVRCSQSEESLLKGKKTLNREELKLIFFRHKDDPVVSI